MTCVDCGNFVTYYIEGTACRSVCISCRKDSLEPSLIIHAHRKGVVPQTVTDVDAETERVAGNLIHEPSCYTLSDAHCPHCKAEVIPHFRSDHTYLYICSKGGKVVTPV